MGQDLGQNTEQMHGVAACLRDVSLGHQPISPFSGTLGGGDRFGLSPKVRLDLVSRGEATLTRAWPILPASLYRRFVETGDRAQFEARYFQRRQMLNDLVLAEIVEGKDRFISAIEDGALLLCEEGGWQLPAHNRQERGGRTLSLPDPEQPVIDLFAAETAAQLATLVHVLGKALDAQICHRIDRDIHLRVLQPYLERSFWWMGNDGGQMNNWTAWCTQSVLITAFLGSSSLPDRNAIAKQAATSLDAFLAEYGPDGACPEGITYYRHAALCLSGALRILDLGTDGGMAPILASPKVRNMMDYVHFAHFQDEKFANFGDAGAVMRGSYAQMFIAGKMVRSPELCHFAKQQNAAFPPTPEIHDFSLFNRLAELQTEVDLNAAPIVPVAQKEGYAKSIGMFVARRKEFTVAAKAGHNGDDHNHNDVGSVIVHKNGHPVLIDVGVETYSRKTFSAQRYEIWTMQSSFHNLPEFDGVEQRAGKAFTAQATECRFGEKQAIFETEISQAYPAEAEVRSYCRRMTLERRGKVTITDRFEGGKPATLNLMTCEMPSVNGRVVTLGDLATLHTQGAGAIEIDRIDITDARLRAAWPKQLYRLRLPFDGPELRIEIT